MSSKTRVDPGDPSLVRSGVTFESLTVFMSVSGSDMSSCSVVIPVADELMVGLVIERMFLSSAESDP